MEKINLTVLVILICLAILTTLRAIGYFVELRKYKRYEGNTIAKVIEIRENVFYGHNAKMTIYYLTFEDTVEEKHYKEENKWGYGNEIWYPLGSEVRICYNKKNPYKFVVSGEENHWKKILCYMALFSIAAWIYIIYGVIHDVFF